MIQGEAIWTPPADWRRRFEMGRYIEWLRLERGLDFPGYDELWRWSVTDIEGFWASIWDYFGVRAHTPYERVLGSREMPGAEWFPGATLNFAEHMLGRDEDLDSVAIIAHSQTREARELTFGELREQVARARAGLKRLGVGPGDRVVAYLPNIPETAVAFLATASLGAVWATCPPEFGVRSVVDRLGQLDPKVLLAVGGYVYGEKVIDRAENVAAIRERLPTLEAVVDVEYAGGAIPGAIPWDELLGEPGPLEFDPVPFAHPLYVLFSSGTTGLPKAIVHGHGGILLEHLKNLGLAWDVRPGDRLQWFTTTAWMMWNALVSALLLRASIVMLDGNPGYPDLGHPWKLAEETRPTLMGISPAFALACRKQGVEPGRQYDLSSLRSLTVAGSPLPVDGFEWIYEQVDAERSPHQRQRRNRHVHRHRPGLSAPARVRRRDRGSLPRRRRGCVRRARRGGRRRAGRARDPPADAVDGGPVLERPRRRAVPRRVLRPLPRHLASRRLDHVQRARQLRDHGTLRCDPEPRRGAARDERVLRGSRGAGRGGRQPGRPPGGGRTS